ncbi:MAG: universal stress protein [Synechococcus sp. SB0668_bin_15]|nr:universal stress protein [Synechococcus sp. SB0668_bin_15]MXZ82896.1 universal stress protein [Synechococcus sp. SB0666_bin_14]MYC49805.1 universal stress protein [Synechococcus sp. SB0662_bin_14]MYG45877.1 universal stress protein [Synechococcus sp. SB0675_bin_6]
MFRNILVADSGKGHVETMVSMMQRVPSFAGARFTLLHVLNVQGKYSLTDGMETGARLLAQAVGAMKLDPATVTTVLRQGDVKQTVLAVADEINADLIVMGSRGVGRLQSILVNSASQYVFQLSMRPMLLVRDDLYVRHPNRLLVAVDGTAISDSALNLACDLARGVEGMAVRVVHVSNQSGGSQVAKRILDKARLSARRLGVDVEMEERSGNPAQEICAAVEAGNSDLLVLASPDRRPSVARNLVDLDKLLGSSISDYVRVKAPCPVLLVR